ncbi:MAG TPA: hypothetical protein VIH42_09340 [Thermoguttaceae bacterium]
MMNKAASKLINAWRGLQIGKPPYILDGDEIIQDIGLCHPYSNFHEYIGSKEFGNELPKMFHTGLLPVPYSGNIIRASIYILGLNPGFGPLNYYEETFDKKFRQESTCQLKQMQLNHKYPWPWLNPVFSWTGGGKYWTRKLREIINKVAEQKQQIFVDAMKSLSKRIATLEFVPYHSKSYSLPRKIVKQMNSPELMRNFVYEYVVPRVIRGEAIVVVLRHGEVWDLPMHNNIIIYKPPATRAAHLSLKSKGGKAIFDWTGKNK